MNQGPTQVLTDQCTDNNEVDAGDIYGQPDVEGEDIEECIVLSDEDDSQGIACEQVFDNGDVGNGDLAGKEVAEDAAEKTDDEDDNEEDDIEDEEAEQERAKVEPGFFADDLELLELTLPQQSQIKDKVLKMWNLRKLIVYPVSEDELETPQMSRLLKDPHCTQVVIHLDREKPSLDSRFNYLDLVFDSKDQALKATDELKGFSSGLIVLNAADVDEWKKKDFDESRSVHFSDYESKKWPSCLVCVKYLPHNITEDKLREIFPDAFEVFIYTNDRPNLTETQRLTAFLFYGTPEEAKAVVEAENEKKTSVDTVRLAFFKYDRIMHPQLISPSLLPMSERYVVLKEKRTVERLAKIRGGHCATSLEKFNTKQKEDEMVRKTYGLPTPTVEEMRVIPNLKILKGAETLKVIKQKGLLWRNRDKLLSADPAALVPPIHPENKGLHSGVTNPNKRKRQKAALETQTITLAGPRPAGPTSILKTAVPSGAQPPPRKVMRLVPEPDFTSSESNIYAPPQRGLRPQMASRPMFRPLMPRGIPPRGNRPRGLPPGVPVARLMAAHPRPMMARPRPLGACPGPVGVRPGPVGVCPGPVGVHPGPVGAQPRAGRGYPLQPRMPNQIGSRLMQMAHGDPASSGTSVNNSTSFSNSTGFGTNTSFATSTSVSSAPRQLMAQVTRPQPAAYGGGAMAAPMRRPAMFGQRFPGPGMLMRRGAPRPPSRAGWAVRR